MNWKRPRVSRSCPRRCARKSSQKRARDCANVYRKSLKTRCRASSPMSWRAASRTCSTSTAPITSSTPPAHRRWRRSAPPSRDSRSTITTPSSRAASTATWARRPSSSSARSAHYPRPAHARMPTGQTASSWAKALLCSFSNVSRTPKATATTSTPSCAAWAAQVTARARASRRRTRSARSSQYSVRGRMPDSLRRRPAMLKAMAHPLESATSSRWRA